ncbi:MAG: transcription-repair coupling factor [Verrucomicrobiota bacterium]|nr:transcription-repair coupling factor [Verrucomicrobiota bacterium]
MFDRVSQAPAAQSLARRLENGGVLSCVGFAAPAQPFFAAWLRMAFPNRPIVLVAPDLKAQESFQQDLETWMAFESEVHSSKCEAQTAQLPAPSSQLLFYPAWEVLPHEGRLPHADVISDRLQTLVTLSQERKVQESKSRIVVTSVVALLQRTFAPEDLKNRTRRLHRGDKIAPLDLIEWLEAQGYEPEGQVTQKGELALRGGIVDVFPPTSPWPARLEFFGDELESLRQFDPLTQISRQEISEITIPPAGELGILMRNPRSAAAPAAVFGASPKNSTLLDFLPGETLFLLCAPEQITLRAAEYAAPIPAGDPFFISWPDCLAGLNRRGFTRVELNDDSRQTQNRWVEAHDEPLADHAPATAREDVGVTELRFDSLEAYRPLAERALEPQIAEAQRHEFFQQIHRWLRRAYAVHIFCNNDGERQRFVEIWAELNIGQASRLLGGEESEIKFSDADPDSRHSGRRDACPTLHLGTLSRGFICEAAKLVVVTDAEIFGRYKIQRPRRLKSPHAPALRSALDIDFTELEEGDLVVHLQHGVGKFLGLKNLPASSRSPNSQLPSTNSGTECLVIEYAPRNPGDEPPKLYVPVSEAHLVSKYIGAGKAQPPLNTLGGARWRRAKEQAERAVRDLAAELLQIQAARESQPGHAFKPDAPWQREFESAFIYEETPDQRRAIEEAKCDMEKPKPMDRLICGDVGFGKTEVAIRAAFKAVMDGRQVAVLVPTTVLAQQHFNTFRDRMADYPVRIELLSRFRTRRQQERVVRDLANGAVDIVIGTHRLIQSDIVFKDLGLAVIDEEQRFGVLDKEKFKRLRTLVDVLTLSATPIPRTLYLALTGARDMSTIQTPPHDRLPVETIISQYDERVIRDAIQRELNRGGQVFFLHNRVMTIEAMADRLKKLLPGARIVVGHGQMDSDDLEEVMTKFVNGEADVLLSTTIIESGLDIPNANTIVIDRADRFGLSDLYQLRGRVGRYKHQAYAYLLLPRHASLLTDVRKRISAIRQYATLGSGFKIAMRDLEIRGAGNLLGPEQSGHITAVGFELYCQLLKQSVSALKGGKPRPRADVSVRLDFLETNPTDAGPRVGQPPGAGRESVAGQPAAAALPHGYVTEPRQRIEIYRKLAQAADKAALGELQKEMRDRFGPLPPPVEALLQVAELKNLAGEKSVTAIEAQEDKLMLTRHGDFITLGGKFPRLTKKDARARLREIKKLLLAI